MRRFLLAALLAAALTIPAVSTAFAQDGADPTGDPPAPEETGEGEDEKEARNEPQIVMSGVKVEVKLISGVTWTGLIRSDDPEIQRGGQYIPAESEDQDGAGLRVFFTEGLNGFVFVRFELLAEPMRRFGELSQAEAEVWRRRILENERKAAEERERLRIAKEEAERRDRGEGDEEEGESSEGEGGEDGSGKPAEKDLEKVRALKIRELMKRFPPEEWKPSKLDELKKRAIILDIYPNDEERAFMDNYDLWLEGYQVWEKSQGASARK